METYLSREEAAEYLGVSVEQIKSWIQKGKLKVLVYKEDAGIRPKFYVSVDDLELLRDRKKR